MPSLFPHSSDVSPLDSSLPTSHLSVHKERSKTLLFLGLAFCFGILGGAVGSHLDSLPGLASLSGREPQSAEEGTNAGKPAASVAENDTTITALVEEKYPCGREYCYKKGSDASQRFSFRQSPILLPFFLSQPGARDSVGYSPAGETTGGKRFGLFRFG